MGGMEKTTVYLTADQKSALARAAQAQGRSEARLIRDGIESVTARHRVAETAVDHADRGRPVVDDGTAEAARRPRWIDRREFIRHILAHPADPGLLAEVREMAPGATDDLELR
jgi:hypothetical protein